MVSDKMRSFEWASQVVVKLSQGNETENINSDFGKLMSNI